MYKNIKKILCMALGVSLLVGATAVSAESLKSSKAEKDFETKIVQVGDQKYEYYTNKDKVKFKETKIIINGAQLSGKGMMELGSKFVKDYKVIIMEVPGHGEIKPETPYNTIEEKASVMEKEIAELQRLEVIKGDFTVIGGSMGGSITQQIAIDQIKGLKEAVLIHTSPRWDAFQGIDTDMFKVAYKDMFPSQVSAVLSSLSSQKEKDRLVEEALTNLVDADTAVSDIKALQSWNSEEQLKNIKVPTLIIGAERDPLASLEMQQILKSNIPNSYLQIVPFANHFYCFENPELYANMIKTFENNLKIELQNSVQ